MDAIRKLKKKANARIYLYIPLKLYKLLFFLAPIMLMVLNALGQVYLSDVEFEKIEVETVKSYLHKQMDNNAGTFADVKPSMGPGTGINGFRYHVREYMIKDSLENVWSHYVYTNPIEAWDTDNIEFGFMFSKKSNEMIYSDQHVEKVETGQIIYLNLNVMKIKNIATAFEITKVDKANGIIEFSYVDDNVTHGKQQLNFIQTPEGHTKIVHRSYFKSKSAFRDSVLYPYFHTRLTNTYHRNMKKLYKKMKSSEPFYYTRLN